MARNYVRRKDFNDEVKAEVDGLFGKRVFLLNKAMQFIGFFPACVWYPKAS